MKRLLAVCLAAVLLLSFTACTDSTNTPATTTTSQTDVTNATTLPTETVTTVTDEMGNAITTTVDPLAPTQAPNTDPTDAPVVTDPTDAPTDAPTVQPTDAPTAALTDTPTVAPTQAPTQAPTVAPTDAPTVAPTQTPTEAHTVAPTDAPTQAPTVTEVVTTVVTTTTTTTIATTTTTRPTVQKPSVTRVITCWGDSITEGMRMADADRYPHILETLLGEGYIVQNSGDGGEDTRTIMARHGSCPVFLEREITFADGETRALISQRGSQGLLTEDQYKLFFTDRLGGDVPINDVTIQGKTYTITLENYVADPRSYDVYLNRAAGQPAVTIPAGTAVSLASTEVAKTNYCDVYLMCANGGFDDDLSVLIQQFQTMIRRRSNDNYLVVIPYWRLDCEDLFKDAFGDKAIDLVEYAKNGGLDALNITPSQEDRKAMSRGYLPMCLTLNNTPVKTDVHLNAKGYRMLASAVFDAGCKLGYWN